MCFQEYFNIGSFLYYYCIIVLLTIPPPSFEYSSIPKTAFGSMCRMS